MTARPIPETDPGNDARAQLVMRLSAGDLKLPVMPAAAARILDACRDDDAGPRRVAEAVSQDMTITAHVLRVANSAAYSPREPIMSLTHAVSMMGLRVVSQMAVALCFRGRLFEVDRYENLIGSVWPEARLAAGWGREAARLRNGDTDEAFLLGLLHDIGKPVILQALIDIENRTRCHFGEEQAIAAMEYLHPRVGAELMRQWNMPESLVAGIAWHHEPLAAPDRKEEALFASLVEHLARWSLAGGREDDTIRVHEALPAIGFGPETVDRLLAAHDRVSSGAENLA